MEKYNPKYIEPKWRKFWEENPDLFRTEEADIKEKKYILDMFPYPSGDGLHVGHVEGYTATDVYSRYMRLSGRNVLHPIGWDAFGLPAENYAIKTGVHPDQSTHKNIKNFTQQIKALGLSYDWLREIDSSDPAYYKWTQWFFLLLYKHGLAYKKKAKVNWCDSCQTVLANEQAEDGICERCKNPVIQKDLEQWFFKITDFVEDKGKTQGLISGLDKVDWPESTKAAQKNWIGRSEGAIVKFKIKKSNLKISNQNSNLENEDMEVFTTRLDTIFGCTYLVVAPEHEMLKTYEESIKNKEEVANYVKTTKKKSDLMRMEEKDKTGVVLDGIRAVNPFTQEEVPVFVADYVLSQYGTGAVMAVPAHDERDYEFAKKYDLPIKQSIAPLYIALGVDAPITSEPRNERNVVIVLIKHWQEDKYLCLNWEKFGWKSFVIGGIEAGETAATAAIREMTEETGYKNIKTIKQVGGETHENFNARHKKIGNRYIKALSYIVELENGEQEVTAPEHTKNHNFVWIDSQDVSEFINLDFHMNYWNIYLHGERATTEDGVLINSGGFSALTSEIARIEMTEWLEKNELGQKKVNYKLRDWLVSRQRYWGAPIPIIYCEQCVEKSKNQNFKTTLIDGVEYAVVPVLEEDLPVRLPTDVDFKPTGESPLTYSKSFHAVKCPTCGGKARREVDTMDTFVCSSWYYFRFADPNNGEVFADKKLLSQWLPVDMYVGGAEHTVLHLLYARFFTKALHSLGYIDFDEPFQKLRHQGMILAPDGRKMSKSLGNVINPDDVIARFGADSLRMFELFMGPLEDAKPWNTQGIVGIYRFLEKVWRIQFKIQNSKFKDANQNSKLTGLLHKTIKKVTEDIENFRFNTAISSLMILANVLEKEEEISFLHYSCCLLLLSPFAPFISEELWNRQGGEDSIFREKWPTYDAELIKDEEVELVIQVNGKIRDKMMVSAEITEAEAKKLALESDKVKNHLSEKDVRKVIFVKGRLLNIVT